MHEQVMQQLSNVPVSADRLSLSDFEVSAGTANQLSELASSKADQLLSVRTDTRVVPVPVAFESFTTDGTASNTETFNLGSDIIQSSHTSEDLVLWKDDGNGVSKVSEDSIDYAADSFNYTDSGSDNDLFVFYASGAQARLIVRVVGPNGVQKDLIELDAGLVHRRGKLENPIKFSFNQSLEGIVPRDFRVKLLINAPYQAKFEHSAPSGTVTADNGILSVPVRRAQQRVDGAGRAVRHAIAEG